MRITWDTLRRAGHFLVRLVGTILAALALLILIGGSTVFAQEREPAATDAAPHARSRTNGKRASRDVVPPAAELADNPELARRAQRLLPFETDVDQAAAGFRDTKEFLAAAHAANNLAIPFHTLKFRLTGARRLSLAAAIRHFNRAVNPQMEVARAVKQAREDLWLPSRRSKPGADRASLSTKARRRKGTKEDTKHSFHLFFFVTSCLCALVSNSPLRQETWPGGGGAGRSRRKTSRPEHVILPAPSTSPNPFTSPSVLS